MRLIRILLLVAAVFGICGLEASARGHRPYKPFKFPKIDHINVPPPAVENEKPLEWHTDFEKAAELADEENRPLMLLFTTEKAVESDPRCRFAGDALRKSARAVEVVPVKILPPPTTDTEELSREEAEEARKKDAEAWEAYRALVKRYKVEALPSLVFCASDEEKLLALRTPADSQILKELWRLGGLVEDYEKDRDERAAPDGGDVPQEPVKGDAEPDADAEPEAAGGGKDAPPPDDVDDF